MQPHCLLAWSFEYITAIVSSGALDPGIGIPLHMSVSVHINSLTTGLIDYLLGQECEDFTDYLLNLLENNSDTDSFAPESEAVYAEKGEHSGPVVKC